MGITNLFNFVKDASRDIDISEFSGCTVAIDSYCWLNAAKAKCADGYLQFCMRYVDMLLSKNIKPILVFDGMYLPSKAVTKWKGPEQKEAYISDDVKCLRTMALGLIKECRRRNVDYIVAPYEADAQLAYLNIKNIAQLVITQDSDLIVFGCSKVLCKMNTKGKGVLFESDKLPLVMKCPVQQYSFNKFRQMCILSGCDYLESLPGIGLVKARQFVTATQDPNIANALKRLPSTLNKTNLVVTDEYRERFLKAEASFKHQYVYDPLERQMVRLTEPDDEDIQWCVSAGKLLDPEIAFQLALGNLYPLTLKKIDDWRPDNCSNKNTTYGWLKQTKYPSIWSPDFKPYINEARPWEKKVRKVPQTKAQDESLSVQSRSSMYYGEPATKKLKMDYDKQDDGNLTKYTQVPHDTVLLNNKSADSKEQSPVVDLTDLKTPSKSLGLKNYFEFKKKIVHKRM